MSEYAETIRTLRQKRAQAMAQVEKIDNAIAVLEDLDRETTPAVLPPVAETEPSATGANGVATSENSSTGRRTQAMSVKSRVTDLLLRNPNRSFSTADIIREFDRSGEPLKAKNVGNAVRTALFEAAKERTLERVEPGIYRGVVPSPLRREAS